MDTCVSAYFLLSTLDLCKHFLFIQGADYWILSRFLIISLLFALSILRFPCILYSTIPKVKILVFRFPSLFRTLCCWEPLNVPWFTMCLSNEGLVLSQGFWIPMQVNKDDGDVTARDLWLNCVNRRFTCKVCQSHVLDAC